MKKLKVIIIGAGNRGEGYAKLMKKHSDLYEVVAVADPSASRRRVLQGLWELSDECCYESFSDILQKPKMADVAVISTLDDMHYEPALKAIALGYDLLLEKPVAPTERECVEIALAAEKASVKVLVCHVLRYTDFYSRIKEMIMRGDVGEVMSVVAVEAVGCVHQSHSFVRGNWHSEAESAPMLLAKCCHDVDILQWLIDRPCKKVSSFGSLGYFRKENAPEGAPVRCSDGGCPVSDSCPYNCIKLYYDDKKNAWFRGALAGSVSKDSLPTDQEVLAALSVRDYGLCVFHANNDVVDHQVVNMEFEGGVTAQLTMNAFNRGGRYIRIFGTKGELYANMSDAEITLYTFEDKKTSKIEVSESAAAQKSGHGGGDEGIICELYEYLTDNYSGYRAADIMVSVKNHLICFAAEKARRLDTVERIDGFFEQYGIKND